VDLRLVDQEAAHDVGIDPDWHRHTIPGETDRPDGA